MDQLIYSESKGSALTNLEFSNDLRKLRVAINALEASFVPLPSIIPTTMGGTGANLTLVGNRVIISSGAVMAENDAILANRAIISNGVGLPTHSNTTATEISYVNGVTSSIQTQLDGKYDTPSGTTAQYVRGDGSIANFPTGLPPGGPAGGDLTGTYPSPLIGSNKVTYAKFQQVSAQRILGNPTGSAANVSEISLGNGLSFNGTQIEVNGALSQWINNGNDIYFDTGDVGIGTNVPQALLDLAGIWRYNAGSVNHIHTFVGDIFYKLQNESTTGYASFYILDDGGGTGISINQYGSAYVQSGDLDIAGTTSITTKTINWGVPDTNTFKVWTGTSGSLVENFRIEQDYTRTLNRLSLQRGISLVPGSSNISVLPYNVAINDSNIVISAAMGNVVLPDTTLLENGHTIVIQTITGSTPTIVPFNPGTENIMGSASYSMIADQTIWLQKFPLNWRIIAQYNASTGLISAVTAPLQVLAGNLSIATNGISDSLFRQSAALSVVGNATNATANVADITAGSDYNILRRNGTSIGFGSIDLSQSGAVGASILGIANGGTGSTAGAWLLGGSYSLSSSNTISTSTFDVTFSHSNGKNLRIENTGGFQIWNGATSGQPTFYYNPTGFNSLPSLRLNPNGATYTQNAVIHVRGESTTSSLVLRIDDSNGIQLMGLTQNGQLNVPQTVAFTVTGSSGTFVTTRGLQVNVQGADITNLNNLFNIAPTASFTPISTEGSAYSFMNNSGSIGGNNLSNIRFNIYRSNPTYNFTGTSTGIIRGFYHSPTLTSLANVDHRAWENVTGNMIVGSTSGDFAVGTGTPLARAHIVQSTLGNEILRLESTASNDDPRESTFAQKATTTDATITTIATIAIPASTTVMIEAKVTARRTGGTAGTAEDGAGYIVCAVYKNVAGTATEIGESSIFSAEDQAAWTVTITPSSGNALVQVTGAVDNNISWSCIYRTYPISS